MRGKRLSLPVQASAVLLSSLAVILSCLTARAQTPVCDITFYDEDDGLSQAHVTQLMQDEDGFLWFATWNGLNRFDGNEFTLFKSHAGDDCDMPSDRIRNICPAPGGDIYCRADKRWFLFHREDGSFHPVDDATGKQLDNSKNKGNGIGAQGKEIRHTDANGTTWTIDKEGRLCHAGDPTPVATLPDIGFYISDRQGNLWLTSSKNGVVKLSFGRRPARHVTGLQGEIGAMMTDSKGNCWISTKENRQVQLRSVNAFDRPQYLTSDGRTSSTPTAFGASVYCIFESSNGDIWMGTKPGGVYRLRPARDHYQVSYFPTARNVYDIREDAWGRLWMASMGDGLIEALRPDADNPEFILVKEWKGYPALKENKIRFLYLTADRLLLAATTEGLLVLPLTGEPRPQNPSFRWHVKEAGRASSLSCNALMDIFEGSDLRLYVSTESGGVCCLTSASAGEKELSFRHFDTAHGMGTDVALALFDRKQQVTVVGNNQIMTLDGMSYDGHFFQEPLRFSDARPLYLPHDGWLFGLSDGAVIVPDSFLHKGGYVPDIVLTGLSLGNNVMLRAVNHLSEIRLRPDERSLTLYFSATDYQYPENIRYAFKMEEDTVWNYIGHNRTVAFADLKPGTYRLQIRSTNSDGVWVDNTRTLTVEVAPKFFETVLGQLLLWLLFFSIAGGGIYTYLYIRRIKPATTGNIGGLSGAAR